MNFTKQYTALKDNALSSLRCFCQNHGSDISEIPGYFVSVNGEGLNLLVDDEYFNYVGIDRESGELIAICEKGVQCLIENFTDQEVMAISDFIVSRDRVFRGLASWLMHNIDASPDLQFDNEGLVKSADVIQALSTLDEFHEMFE